MPQIVATIPYYAYAAEICSLPPFTVFFSKHLIIHNKKYFAYFCWLTVYSLTLEYGKNWAPFGNFSK